MGLHPDRLIAYNGNTISYDSLGRPTKYGAYTYTWNKDKLAGISKGSSTQYGSLYEFCGFTYNGYGQRIAKNYVYDNNPGSTSDYSYNYRTTYTYDHSGRLIHEAIQEIMTYTGGSTRNKELLYLYDESGIIGCVFTVNGTSTTYYYQRNLLGDVVGIYDTNGNKVVGYAYDAWGNCTITYGSNNEISRTNPIRYRGYYLDRETNLYYLNARYYNPQWCRFISPDNTSYLDPESVNGLNLYCYCNNDPVNYADPSGQFAISLTAIGLIFGATLFATAGGIAAYNIAKNNGAEGLDLLSWTALGIIGGGLIGAALGYGAGALISKVTGVLGFSIFKGHVFTITQTIVLGHRGYTDIAKSLGYGFYEISNNLYNSLSSAQRWAMNSQYLKDCAKLGANFLVEAKRVISPTYNGNISYLYYEIQYLLEKGYMWLEDLSALVK